MPADVKLTETVLPVGGDPGRSVFGSATADTWATGLVAAGRNRSGGNFWFDGGTIYSYGRHFPVARRVRAAGGGPPFVLLTTRTYSVTTARHVRAVRAACGRTPTPTFAVADVLADDRQAHVENLVSIRAAVAAAIELARKARTNRPAHLSRAAATAAAGNAYAAAVGLPDRV